VLNCVQCREVIEQCLSQAQQLMSDLDLHLVMHDRYGKGLIKRCKVSPDAYIQMALQLAYYRVTVSRHYCAVSVVIITDIFVIIDTVFSCQTVLNVRYYVVDFLSRM